MVMYPSVNYLIIVTRLINSGSISLMTLVVSLRIPDGIVIAGDSLATMMGNLEAQADIPVQCPECGKSHTVQVHLPPISLPATTFSYAQKVFPFLGKYGVGTTGIGQLTGKTIYFAMRQLEQELVATGKVPNGVKEVADIIAQRTHEMLKSQLQHEDKDIEAMPDSWIPLGFQIVGYENDEPITVEIQLGKNVQNKMHISPGFTATGVVDVVQALLSAYKTNPNQRPVYEVFSLQDAISYAEFLINTTSLHQQFSRMIPNVGGEIDVALVTPFDDFKWIKQKYLAKLLGDTKWTKDKQ